MFELFTVKHSLKSNRDSLALTEVFWDSRWLGGKAYGESATAFKWGPGGKVFWVFLGRI